MSKSDFIVQEVSCTCLYQADVTAVIDRRQLCGHQKGRGFVGVTRSQQVTGMWSFLGRGGGISSTGQGLADPQGATTAQAHRDQEEEPAGFSTG